MSSRIRLGDHNGPNHFASKHGGNMSKIVIFMVFFVLVFAIAYFVGASYCVECAECPEAQACEPVEYAVPAPVSSASSFFAAVRSSDNVGIIGGITAEVRDGEGRVLVDTQPNMELDTQVSAEIAAFVAQQFTEKSLQGRDLIFTIRTDYPVVGGPSAGAAMTAVAIAALNEEELRDDVVITGTIREDGAVGKVSGIFEKANASAESGKSLFLVPKTQSLLPVYTEERIKEVFSSGEVEEYVKRNIETLNLSYYADEVWGMQLEEVSSITEAYALMVK